MASIIELHTLRTLGVSSLNRGENGEVKTTIVGDIARSRISSQAMKAPIREEFGQTLRTRVLFSNYLIPKCKEEHPELEKDFRVIAKILLEQKDQIMAYSEEEVNAIYDFIIHMSEEDKELLLYGNESKNKLSKTEKERVETMKSELKSNLTKAVRQSDVSLDVAIFGRMSTDGPLYTIPSAVHINHAYSIDQHHNEEDFFTAFDNLKKESAHLNASEFTSATMYSYMNIDPVQVYRNLMLPVENRGLTPEEYKKVSVQKKELAIKGVVKAAELMLQVLPSGKQNAMASYPMPSMIYATIDNHTYPCTLDPCFNRIVRSYNDKSVVSTGTERIMNYVSETVDPKEYRAFFVDTNLKEELNEDTIQKVKDDGITFGGMRQKTELLEEIRKKATEMIEDFME